ncbi:protein kinase [Plasmopara halstedii]|uniref:Protein kinase n=1 Tax=Plasmopara halstedii TaxID=4781 RepID=A0A0P1ALT1_PLAHL|nr:protein kinase [Plasmopara halstedii]CEG41855.1 protein kinase [Plasmopara halstedii]|eukprot:XP_024578224.1 protein kinase [Plasmopara halstedii]
MHGDLRGFYGAPVTYAFSLAVGAASSASLLLDSGHLLSLDRDAVLNRLQYWRLLSNQLTFHHGLAVSLGLYSVFQFRVLERQLGSRKFGSILVFVLSFSGALQLIALTSYPELAKIIPGGPYSFLGALVVYFNKFIPKLHPRSLSFWGLNFSEKSSTYFLLLLLLAHDFHALIPFFAGSFCGYLFNSTPLGQLRLPSFLCSIFNLLHPLFDVVPASTLALQRQRRALEAQRRVNARFNRGRPGQGFRDQLLPGAGGMMPGGGLAAGGMLPPHLAAAPPSEDIIQQLMALGFDREHALQALQETDNNVEAAANRLLNNL